MQPSLLMSRDGAGRMPGTATAWSSGRRAVVVALALAAGGAGASDRPAVPVPPSGIEIAVQEVLLDVKPDGVFTYARYRFVSPFYAGSGAPGFEARLADMQFLCDSYALPLERGAARLPDRIAISIADRETEFGVAAPDATQFFELYSIENDACIWEEF